MGDIWAMLPLYIMLLPMLPLFTMLLDMEFPMLLTQSVFMVLLLLLCQLSMVLMQVLEDMLLTLQELFMLPSVRLRPMLSIPLMEWVILDAGHLGYGVAHTGYAATPIHHGVTYTAPVHHAAAYAAPVHHAAGIPAVHGAYAGAGRYVANSAGTVHVAKREAEA